MSRGAQIRKAPGSKARGMGGKRAGQREKEWKTVIPNSLFEGFEELDTEKPDFAGSLLAEDLRDDRWRLHRHESRGGGRRSGDSQVDNLILPEEVGRSNTCARCADIEGFCEFDEIYAGCILGAEKYRNLQSNPGKSPLPSVFHKRKSL